MNQLVVHNPTNFIWMVEMLTSCVVQLELTAVSKDAIYSVVSDKCEFCLCDNRWHTVQATLIRNVVTLKVDDGRMLASVSSGTEMSLNTDNELYIGGFPSTSTFLTCWLL